MHEIVFQATQESDGGYSAECLTENIFTQGDTWEELRKNVVEATTAFFFDRPLTESDFTSFAMKSYRWPENSA